MTVLEYFQIHKLSVNALSHAWFKTKIVIEKISILLDGVFWIDLPSFINIFINWNHYLKCRLQMKDSATIAAIIF